MKLTLQELNDHMWYRGLKVVYIVFYLALFVIGLLYIIHSNRDHIPPRLPSSANEALQDSNFFFLSTAEMISVLNAIDVDFENLPEEAKQEVITKIKQNKSMYAKGEAIFIYFPRTKVNITRALLFAVMYVFATIIIMEFIRHCFYYILIGKFFPKRR